MTSPHLRLSPEKESQNDPRIIAAIKKKTGFLTRLIAYPPKSVRTFALTLYNKLVKITSPPCGPKVYVKIKKSTLKSKKGAKNACKKRKFLELVKKTEGSAPERSPGNQQGGENEDPPAVSGGFCVPQARSGGTSYKKTPKFSEKTCKIENSVI
jgi:hypothetical protein